MATSQQGRGDKGLYDFSVHRVKTCIDPVFRAEEAGLSRGPIKAAEPAFGLASARNDDLFPSLNTLQQFRQPGFRLVDIYRYHRFSLVQLSHPIKHYRCEL